MQVNNEILFQYLRQILYDPENAVLQARDFPSDQQKLADGLQVLHKFVLEERRFCNDISQGIVAEAEVPSRKNVLSAPLKAVHNMLQHLVWLMDEVRAGDYRQRLHFANDLSASFNAMVDQLIELSMQDRLTGILNTDGFDEKAMAQLQTADAQKKYFMLSINVNDFHHFNTLYGPEMGDELLCRVADFLRSVCKAGEICARLHADHFMCLVMAEAAEDVAARFNVDGAHLWPGSAITMRTYLFRHGIYPVTDVSIGIRNMRNHADFAGQSIQHSTQVNYAVFDDFLWHRYQLENTRLEHFQRAVKGKEFEVYYQPKVDPENGRILGCEALVRWQSPVEGLLLPENFIGLFEANGLITALDFYVLEEVCQKLQRMIAKQQTLVPVSVNFSQMHLLNADFSANILQTINKYHVPAKYIEIEITETAFFENMEQMICVVEQLHGAGLRIAMDDFGSGFSSLNFLRSLPLDVMKIDKLFFNSFADSPKSRLLLEDILSIARHLGLTIVAEGIETAEQVTFLQQHHCDMIQGYYFYKPLCSQAFDAALEVSNREAVVR